MHVKCFEITEMGKHILSYLNVLHCYQNIVEVEQDLPGYDYTMEDG